jgi:hypothetical protein
LPGDRNRARLAGATIFPSSPCNDGTGAPSCRGTGPLGASCALCLRCFAFDALKPLSRRGLVSLLARSRRVC